MWSVFLIKVFTSIMASQGIQMLVVSNTGISMYDTTTGARSKLMSEHEMLLKEVDYHYERGEIYGLTKRQILRCPLRTDPLHVSRPVVYSEDEYNFMSMAVDWVHDRLYWTAGPVFMIHRAKLDGSDHQILYRGYYIENHHKKLLVDPHARLLIWATANQIFSADLDGQNLQEIRFPEVLGHMKSRVKNLALDVTRKRVYFLAGFDDDDVWLLMSGNYDGSGFRRHDSVSRYTFAVAAMGDDLYWVTKEMGEATYAPRGFTKFHNLVLYRASSQTTPAAHRVMALNTGAVWNMKICDPNSQRPRLNISSSS